MTDLGETVVQPELIATHYLTSVDDVAEHLRAANQLGLGVRVRSYVEASEDGEELIEGWEVELLTSSPLQEAEAAEIEAAEEE
ncbi:hypothetical protein [Paractinoplanes maris]|uniref:hypothetical protein n=1 Tax=Paractinoplanes maris TaxID=1734446 RepID=UPI0020200BE0|nr:hypothetical protein [Actinoplanes maris]